MKRGGRLRRTKGVKRSPLKRGDKPLKRTKRINRISKKRAKVKRETDGPRAEYVQRMGRCAVYPYLPAVECHEIASGSDREKALYEPACWLAVSRQGHDVVQHEKKAKQLARKLIADPENYDLEKFNAVYQGQESPVTNADVASYLTLAVA